MHDAHQGRQASVWHAAGRRRPRGRPGRGADCLDGRARRGRLASGWCLASASCGCGVMPPTGRPGGWPSMPGIGGRRSTTGNAQSRGRPGRLSASRHGWCWAWEQPGAVTDQPIRPLLLRRRALPRQIVQGRCAGGIVQLVRDGELVRAWRQRPTRAGAAPAPASQHAAAHRQPLATESAPCRSKPRRQSRLQERQDSGSTSPEGDHDQDESAIMVIPPDLIFAGSRQRCPWT